MRKAVVIPLILIVAPPSGSTQAPGYVPRFVIAQGEQVRVSLTDGSEWATIGPRSLHVTTLGARTFLQADDLPSSTDLVFVDRGCSVLSLSFDPGSGPGSSFTKLILCRRLFGVEGLLERMRSTSLVTNKNGDLVEIRPLNHPALVLPGTDLAVRLYVNGVTSAGYEVVAEGSGGARVTGLTDEVGTTSLRLSRGGTWRIWASARVGAVDHRAELQFVVPERLPSIPRRAAGPHSASPASSATDWQELGPAPLNSGSSGRAAGIAVSSTRPGRYFVAAAGGGIWRTNDGGASWSNMTAGLPIITMGAVALDPSNHRVVYAGSGEANGAYHSVYGLGLYRSTNGGRDWEVAGAETFAGKTFARIAVSPHDGNVVLAAVNKAGGRFRRTEAAKGHPGGTKPVGLFRSDDAGASWARVRNGLPKKAASDVLFDPVSPERIFVGIGEIFGSPKNGVYRSSDGGTQFNKLGGGLPISGVGRVTLAISRSDPDVLYALIAAKATREDPGGFAPGGAPGLGLYRTADGGDTWKRHPVGNLQSDGGYYYSAVTVLPNDPDTVFAGGVQLRRSRDGGAAFTEVTPPHVDLHGMAFDANGRLVAANDGGVHRSADEGASWSTLNAGVSTIQYYPGLSTDPLSSDGILIGSQDNGTHLRVNGEWFVVLGGDGGVTAYDPGNPDVLFAEFQGTGNLFRSTNGGLSFARASTGIDPTDRNCFLPPFVFDPNDDSRMLYATHRIYQSRNGGASWTAISGDITGGGMAAIRSLVIAPSDSSIVYATTNDDRVVVSSDGGSTFTLALTDIGGWPRVMRQLAVDQLDASRAYVAVQRFGVDQVLRSTNGGETWQGIDGDLPDIPVNTLAVHNTGATRFVFAGTDRGVYVTIDGGTSWTLFGTGMPHTPVMDIRVDENHHRLVATTLGRGAWTIVLPR